MNKSGFFLTIALTSLTFFSVQAQDQDGTSGANDVSITIPEVALLDVEPVGTNSVALNPKAPTEAGNFLDFSAATDESLWINYSSVVGSKTEPSRKVTVMISSGFVPKGLDLYVAAAAASNGKGALGTSVGQVKLTETPTDLITDIGSCYTEDGLNNGHQLSYSLQLSNDDDLISMVDFDDTNSLVITYTLTDN